MRPSSPPALRNREPIGERLGRAFAAHGHVRAVLEIATGTGEHIEHFAARFPDVEFQPTEFDPRALEHIDARLGALRNVREARVLDVCGIWPATVVDVVIVANMFHISPLATVAGFFAGAQSVLRDSGFVHVYGPFKRNGVHTAASNAAFDESLQGRDPSWGIRDLEAVIAQAQESGFVVADVVDMPANNLSLLFEQASSN